MEKTPVMDPILYQNLIDRTAVYPKEYGVAYTFIGLVEEIGELREKLFELHSGDVNEYSIAKELGDCYWYVVATLKELGMLDLFSEIYNTANKEVKSKIDTDTLLTLIEKLDGSILDFGVDLLVTKAGMFKKYIRDGMFVEEAFIDLFSDLLEYFKVIANAVGYDTGQILHINFDKLMKRRDTGTLHGSGDNREENK